jgi:hypothetical protein
MSEIKSDIGPRYMVPAVSVLHARQATLPSARKRPSSTAKRISIKDNSPLVAYGILRSRTKSQTACRLRMQRRYLCGGWTVWSALTGYDLKPTDHVGVVGIGGLGHFAIQFANKMGLRSDCVLRHREQKSGCFYAWSLSLRQHQSRSWERR